MGEIMETTRSEYSLKLDGKSIKEHEIPVELFTRQLVSFEKLAESINSVANGKTSFLIVKVKGEIKPGSVDVNLIIETLNATLPLVPDIMTLIFEYLNIKKFLKNEKPQEVQSQEDGKVIIKNNEGATITANAPVINILNSNNVSINFNKFTSPIVSQELSKICLKNKSENTEEQTSLFEFTEEDKDYLAIVPQDEKEITENEYTLQILTSNNDGKAEMWRFRDLEEQVEFTATIQDDIFLDKIINKEYNFQRDDQIKVKMKKIKQKVNKRFKTERYILEVLDFIRQE